MDRRQIIDTSDKRDSISNIGRDRVSWLRWIASRVGETREGLIHRRPIIECATKQLRSKVKWEDDFDPVRSSTGEGYSLSWVAILIKKQPFLDEGNVVLGRRC